MSFAVRAIASPPLRCATISPMTNLDYWTTFVGEESPESFLRRYGTTDPVLGVSRFLEDRGQLYGVVNQGTWVTTFNSPEQFHRMSVEVYLLSYLEETREDWQAPLEAQPPHTPRRYLEKFDPERHGAVGGASETEEDGTYGSFVPGPEFDVEMATDAAAPEVPEVDSDPLVDDEAIGGPTEE